jgi:hypothetical protein
MTQMEMFEVHEKMPPPDEIVEHDGFTVRIYLPRYHSWMQAVDEAIMDMTGYSVYEFAEYPTESNWRDWPRYAEDVAVEVLRRDMWGQAFLDELDLA